MIIISILAGNYGIGVQYFLIDGLAVGGRFGITGSDQSDDSTLTIILEPMLSYYFRLNSFLPFLGAGYQYIIIQPDNAGGITTNIMSGFTINGGAAMMITDTLAVYAEGSYTQQAYTPDGGSAITGNIIVLALGFKGFF